jgi:hypothetical protein
VAHELLLHAMLHRSISVLPPARYFNDTAWANRTNGTSTGEGDADLPAADGHVMGRNEYKQRRKASENFIWLAIPTRTSLVPL